MGDQEYRDKKYRRFLEDRTARISILRANLEAFLPEGSAITLEIGCGHGHFLTAFAEAHAETFCLGIDLVSKRIRKATLKGDKRGLDNLLFMKAEVTEFLEAWPPSCEVGTLFVLYPDPWPKKRHEKNRILRSAVLDQLARISSPAAMLHFRTDDPRNFAWVREVLTAHPRWRIQEAFPWPFESPSFFQDLLGIHESLSAIREA